MRIVIVAGGFDPFHRGHLDHIEKARSLGDKLVVILQSDRNLKRKKDNLWLLPYEDREAPFKMAGIFTTPNIDADGTCAETIRDIVRFMPNYKYIFAKGGDRTPDNMPENEIRVCRDLDIKIEYGIGNLLGSSSNITEEFRRRQNEN